MKKTTRKLLSLAMASAMAASLLTGCGGGVPGRRRQRPELRRQRLERQKQRPAPQRQRQTPIIPRM